MYVRHKTQFSEQTMLLRVARFIRKFPLGNCEMIETGMYIYSISLLKKKELKAFSTFIEKSLSFIIIISLSVKNNALFYIDFHFLRSNCTEIIKFLRVL